MSGTGRTAPTPNSRGAFENGSSCPDSTSARSATELAGLPLGELWGPSHFLIKLSRALARTLAMTRRDVGWSGLTRHLLGRGV
jgi:hypothetical protein